MLSLFSVLKYILLIFELASRNFGVQINCFPELRNHSLVFKVCATLEAIFFRWKLVLNNKVYRNGRQSKCLTERKFYRHLRSTTADCIQDMESARTQSPASRKRFFKKTTPMVHIHQRPIELRSVRCFLYLIPCS